ncbi:hypothetical protein AVEN_167347-1 [Araneus ventricosus]|uniref:Uncharacterized protein n=1 Tax=Araneus ventricosus TaxID=182803 RepID=A0A4Y2TPA0_ARAVE|nr:hypothetical protein AVEN_167347-1 [Araneus ventricosus]
MCCFPRYDCKYLAHQWKWQWPDSVIASVLSHAEEVFRRRNGVTVRIPPTTVHKYAPPATRDLVKPSAVGKRLYGTIRNKAPQVN